MEQLVRIFYKKRLITKAIFNSYILTSRLKSAFKGYKETFPKYVVSLKASASILPPSDPINVDPDTPEVIQPCPYIKYII